MITFLPWKPQQRRAVHVKLLSLSPTLAISAEPKLQGVITGTFTALLCQSKLIT